MNEVYLDYSVSKNLIKEGDILLFKGKGLVASLIRKAANGKYSHVGIASWVGDPTDGMLECIEFREGSLIGGILGSINAGGGGRAVSLYQEVKKYPALIDVYRPNPYFLSQKLDKHSYRISIQQKHFNGKLVTKTMRLMTGLPYGWKRIWWLFKRKMVGLRLFYSDKSLVDDTLHDIIYPVCSTAVAYSFSLHDYDLVKNKSDEWTEPSHISMSGCLSYLFTLV